MPPVRPTNRRHFLGAAATTLLAGCATLQAGQDDTSPETIQVPADQPSIQAGVDAASPGDLVLVDEGTYEESVAVETPELTIRGVDRNAVVLDGGFDRTYGIDVEADGVAVENLTARNYESTGIYWSDVEGFRGSYLTAHDNGGYGIYAYRSRDGRFEYSYASGHADAGFYLGRNHPFETVVTNVIAEHNALGYSGTSAGGDLTIRDSFWRANGAGIVPHTLDRNDEPQRSVHVVGNVVLDNDDESVGFREHTFPPFGTGIFVWGGSENLVERNVVAGHENFGIALCENVVEPAENVVRGNVVRGSGVADLGLATPAGADNRFANNGFSESLPPDVERDASRGSERVTAVYDRQVRRAEAGEFPDADRDGDTRPTPQPPMPDVDAAPRPAMKSVSVGPSADTERG